mmetsp:Transcript_49478/g.77125  ORF Transcript_49478/g.77125 Transcript_49478/m.77125 type:complete len:328 (+) Transcript_49478:34-1017(+)
MFRLFGSRALGSSSSRLVPQYALRHLATFDRQGQSLTTLRVAGVPEHFNAPFHLASQRGLYKEGGIDFQWAMTPEGTGKMAEALETGNVDVAIMLAEGAVARAAAGAPLKVVGTYVRSPLRWGVHVRKGSDLKDVADLRGKMFGVSRMLSGSHLMAHVLAHQRGWNAAVEAPLKVVNTLDGARKAMASGEIDVWLWEKFTTKHLVDSGEWDIIGEVPTPWPCFLFVASEKAVAEKSSEIAKMVEATATVCREFKANAGGSTISYASEHHKLNSEDATEWLSGTEWACSRTVTEATLQKTQEALVQIGQLDKPVAFEKLFSQPLCQLV